MRQEPRSRISCTTSTTPKRPNNVDRSKPPPELEQSNMNTQSPESILKGKVIKEFVPSAQKEQKVSEPPKLSNEPATSKPSARQPMLRPPSMIQTPRSLVSQHQPRPLRQPFRPPYRQPPLFRPQFQRQQHFPVQN